MSNALVPFADMRAMADVAAKSRMFGFKSPDEALAIMLLCQGEGLHPAVAMRDYHVIQGRPALKADAMLARFQQAGGKVQWKVYTDAEVTGIFSHPAGGDLEVRWTLQQARSIGLTGKDNWRNYPKAMLRARCISEGIRSVYPACIVGIYTPEEVQDMDPPRGMRDVPATVVEPEPQPGAYPLMLPGGQEHSRHGTVSLWIEAFNEIVAKVQRNTKLSEGTKREKLRGLFQANQELIGSMESETYKLINKPEMTNEREVRVEAGQGLAEVGAGEKA